MTATRASIYAAVIGVGLAFIHADHRPPAWDQAHYLHMTYRYDTSLVTGGVRSFVHELRSIDPGRAPLFSIAMMPFNAVLGSSFKSGELLNLALWPVLLYSVHGIARELFNRKAGIVAMVLAATMPTLIGLSHEVLQDFMVATLTTLSILLMLRTREFERRGASIALGVVLALDPLAKVTAAGYVAAPLGVYIVWTGMSVARELRRRDLRAAGLRRLGNIAITLGIGGSVALLWYLPNLSATRIYLALATGGQGVVGNAPPDHGSLRALLAFTVSVVNDGITWLIGLAAIAALLVLLATGVRALIKGHRPDAPPELFRLLFLGTWIAVPWLVVGLSNNWDDRYMASSLPGVAVVVAGLLTAIRLVWLRLAMITATCSLLVVQQTSIVLGLRAVPLLPQQVTAPTSFGDAVLDFSSNGTRWNRRPDPPSSDYPTPILAYLEQRSAANSGPAPHTVALLQTEPYINGNTLSYLAEVHNDPLVFVDVFAQPVDQLRETLAHYDFALYVPVPNDSVHLSAVNSDFAQGEVTPQILALFPHSATFPSAPGQEVMVLDRLH